MTLVYAHSEACARHRTVPQEALDNKDLRMSTRKAQTYLAPAAVLGVWDNMLEDVPSGACGREVERQGYGVLLRYGVVRPLAWDVDDLLKRDHDDTR